MKRFLAGLALALLAACTGPRVNSPNRGPDDEPVGLLGAHTHGYSELPATIVRSTGVVPFTAPQQGVTPVGSTDLTTKAYVDGVASAGAGNKKVKVSSMDTTEDYLDSTLVVGGTLTKVIVNGGSNETLSLAANVGTTSGTVAAGDDSRFTDSRAPTGSAGGDLTGTYPNPTLAYDRLRLDVATTKGDLFAAWGSADVRRFPVGSNGYVLQADSNEASGLKWNPLPGVFRHGLLTHSDCAYDPPVKGSLLVGSATPLWSALPVGTNGYYLVADSSQTQGMKWAAFTPGTGSVTTTEILDGTIVNVDISASAAIAWSKVSKSGAVASDVGAQASDSELTALAGLTSAADRLPYFTGSGTAALQTFTSTDRAFLGAASTSAERTALGLVIGTDVQAYDADLITWAGLTPTTFGQNLVTLTNPGAVSFLRVNADNTITAQSASNYRIDLGLVIGTDVQAYDSDLSTWATLTSTTVGQSLVTLTNPSAVTFIRINADNSVTARSATDFRTDLGLGTLATQSGTFSGTSSGTNTGDQTITLTGDATGTGTGSFAVTLANSGVSAGSYGDSTHVPAITVDAKGRITAVTSTAISGGGGGTGEFIKRSVLAAGTTTFTTQSGTTKIRGHGWAGGGGGGGVTTAISSIGGGGGGAQGGYFEFEFSVSGSTGYTVSIGTGGAGGTAGNTGTTGNNTTITVGGTTVTAYGGLGGAGGTAATRLALAGGAAPAISTNGTFNSSGAPGGPGIGLSASVGSSGQGGGPGGGTSSTAQGNGANAVGVQGAGGAGGNSVNNGGNATGGNGADGSLVIDEFN